MLMKMVLKKLLLPLVVFSLGYSDFVNAAANETFIQVALSVVSEARSNRELHQYSERYSEIKRILESGVLEKCPSINEVVSDQVISALTDPSGVESGISLDQALRILREILRNADQQGNFGGEGGGAATAFQQRGGDNYTQARTHAKLGMRKNDSLSGFVGEENSNIVRQAIIAQLPAIPRELSREAREEHFNRIRLEVVRSACQEGLQLKCFIQERLEVCIDKFEKNQSLSFDSIFPENQVEAEGGDQGEAEGGDQVNLSRLVNLESLPDEHKQRVDKELEDRERNKRFSRRALTAIKNAKDQCDTDARQVEAQIGNDPGLEQSQALIQRLNRPIDDGGPQNVQSFLDLIPSRAQDERFAFLRRTLASTNLRNQPLLVVYVIYKTLDRFWLLNPTPTEVINLIKKIGIDSEAHLKLIMHIKRKAIRRVAKGTSDYQQILSEAIPDAFLNRDYLEANNHLIVETIQSFAARNKASRENLRELRNFVVGPAFANAFGQGLAEQFLVNLEQISAEMPEKIRQNLVQRFIDVIRPLYNEVSPLTEQSEISYYMIDKERCNRVLSDSILSAGETVCYICIEPFSENQKGIVCQFHTENLSNKPHFHICLSQDLLTYLDYERIDGHFPIKCRNDGEKHELPLTRDLLLASGMNLDKIYEIQMKTLASYYSALLELQQGEPLQREQIQTMLNCPSPDCVTVLLHRDQDDNGNVRCQLCDQRWCFSCGARPHLNSTCAEARELRGQGQQHREYLDPSSPIRPCPYCGTPCDKDDNCNSVTCLVCRQQFNIVDGAPREGTPYFALHWFTPNARRGQPIVHPRRRYRVPEDPDFGDAAREENYEKLSAYPGDRPATQDPSCMGYGPNPAQSDQRSQGRIKNAHLIRKGRARYQGN